jgi:asparagine synthase (glutamine-hydrolysing)
MEFAATLPAKCKLSDGRSKRILKAAVRSWLPGIDLDRPKMGFAVPLARWLREGLRELPAEVLLNPVSLARGYFRPERVRTLIAELSLVSTAV